MAAVREWGGVGVALVCSALFLARGQDATLHLIALATFYALLVVGASAPILLHLLVIPRARRPDARQWRWGASIALTGIMLIEMATQHYSPDLFSDATLALNGCYAAGKFGCAANGCCQAMPYRVVKNSLSLPWFEAQYATLTFAFCAFLYLAGEFRSLAVVGLYSHFGVRCFSYWARGIRFEVLHPLRLPDLIVLPALSAAIVLL